MPGEPFIVILAGELDMAALAQLGTAFQDFRHSPATDARVVMRDVTFFDSSALSALLRLRAAAVERGGEVTLVDVPAVVRRVLEVTAMNEVFVIEPAETGRPDHDD